MDLESLKAFLLWCFIFNSAFLMWWFLMIVFAKDFVFKFHGRWFKDLRKESFDQVHYAMMALVKILNLTFFLSPYLALLVLT